ncbi:MAG TPA: hypothetical protein ENI34_05165 [candidate division WOR-3 bacterium]|uniref:Uncharacterized protein n=1 Tax=candidate division WOR-3 bacterium TaxID=2052148 RepID=A0A9C9ELS0_UNCW3|nr:hypothetical protein [candidate division WOR-3 bacterium]
MKSFHLYEVKLLDGTRYQGEIAYRDDKMVILKLRHTSPVQKLRLFYSGIVSIRELGWQKAYALR